MKIIFVGTSEFAVPSLDKLINNNYEIAAVITAIDKPQGRKKELIPSPVKQKALEYKLPLLQPEKISDIEPEISQINPDLIVVTAYGQIISGKILKLPEYGALNLHPSLLPEYRGASPVQNAVLKGERETGVTIIKMDEKMDHGPILAQVKSQIKNNEYYPEVKKRLAYQGADLLIKTIPDYMSGKIRPKPQDDTLATYTKILTKEDGKIDWNKSAKEIEQKIRAFYPWPGAWTYFNNKRVKVLQAKAVDDKQEGAVETGCGYLLLEEVQPEGKKPMNGADFLRGRKLSNK